MNQLTGIIASLESSEHISLVEVDVKGDIFSSVVLETPQENDRLRKGKEITLIFKETEVSIAKGLTGMISLRNRASATIKTVKKEKILTHVVLDYRGSEIVAIISSHSAQRMDLTEGERVEWLVKANEMTLQF